MKTHWGLKNRVGLLIIALIFSLRAQTVRADYCIASGGCGGGFPGGEYICDVQVGDINNIGTGCHGYADYTFISTAMEIGAAYTITVVNGDNWLYEETCGIWVDWNRDGDFYDAEEEIIVSGGPKTFTAAITPPVDASLGDTQMRIRIRESGDPEPCGETGYGEVEDYIITVIAKYGGGTGTDEYPYLIYTAEQMNAIGTASNDWDKHFKLMADIDMSSYSYSTAVIAPDTNNTNYPFFDGASFTGVFDGNGHKITFLTIDDAGADNTYLGLFGRIDGGQVKNLGIEDGSVSGSAGGKGGLAGINNGSISNCYFTGEISGGYGLGGLVSMNSGSLSNCYSTGYVTGSTDIGGLLCSNSGSVSNCYSNSTVSGTGDHIGGLAGWNNSSSIITNCYSSGSVNGRYSIGGLVGRNNYSTVSDCFSNSHVTGDDYIGGLIGKNHGGLFGKAKVLKCYSTGDVNGDAHIGGLLGLNESVTYGSTNVSNCYSTGSVNGGAPVGGLIGNNNGHVSKCYSIGDVYGTRSYVGGLLGLNDDAGKVSDCFWDVNLQTHGIIESFGRNKGTATNVTGLPTEQMQMMSTYTDVDWDFTTPIWKICEGTNYPKLVWQVPAADFLCPDGVDLMDYSYFSGYWMNDNCSDANDCDGSDFDLSGTVGIADLEIFCDHWLEGAGQ